MRKILILLLFFSATLSWGQLWSSVLDPSRAIDWSQVGTLGGIPSRPTICSTLNPGVTAAQIQTAVRSCPQNQTVHLNAGTYNLSAGIDFTDTPNVTLEGAGADLTKLVFTNDAVCGGFAGAVCLRSDDTSFPGGPANTANWTAGYTKGTSVITVSGHTNMKVGSTLNLDQLDDASPTGLIKYVCSFSGSTCSLEGNGGNGNRSGRGQVQTVTITACGTSTFGAACTSNNLTIDPPILADNWSSGKSPGVFYATDPAYGSGVKNLSIDTSATTGNDITIFNCSNCFVSGVRTIIGDGRSHIESWNSTRVTVRDSYMYFGKGLSQSYGFSPYGSTYVRSENNIYQHVTAPHTINGCTGCVFSYEFTIWNFYIQAGGFVNVSWMMHTTGVDLVLMEGNIGAQMYADVFHGSHNLVTLFRNRIIGNQPTCATTGGAPTSCTSAQTPIIAQSFNRAFNIIGNVLGQTGIQQSYQNGTKPIYDVGNGNSEGAVTVPSDSVVGQSMMKWGNVDAITGFGTPRWCGNSSNTGWSTTCGSVSEVPTGISSYANAVPATEALPDSFLYSSKPNWWPASKPWPSIGPDVTGGNLLTCTSGTFNLAEVTNSSQCGGGSSSAAVGGKAFSNPAMDCYLTTMAGPPNGTGSVLTFNASNCYQASASTPGIQIAPLAGFGTQRVGTTSSPLGITVTSNGTADLAITSITIGGTNSGDFSIIANCPLSPSVLTPSSTCTITGTFSPSASGARSATITVVSNAPSSPTVVTMTGTGTAPVTSLSPGSLNFGSVTILTTSPGQTISVSNTGDATLNISSISFSGTDSAMFAKTTTCGATLAPSTSCGVTITFSPSSTGAKSALLNIADDASGSPHTAALSGTGINNPTPSLTISVGGGITIKGGVTVK